MREGVRSEEKENTVSESMGWREEREMMGGEDETRKKDGEGKTNGYMSTERGPLSSS